MQFSHEGVEQPLRQALAELRRQRCSEKGKDKRQLPPSAHRVNDLRIGERYTAGILSCAAQSEAQVFETRCTRQIAAEAVEGEELQSKSHWVCKPGLALRARQPEAPHKAPLAMQGTSSCVEDDQAI